jgi:hypothetical protein
MQAIYFYFQLLQQDQLVALQYANRVSELGLWYLFRIVAVIGSTIVVLFHLDRKFRKKE